MGLVKWKCVWKPWIVIGVVLLFTFANSDPVKSGCQRPETPPYSTYESTGVKGSDQIEYRCLEGYELVGEKIRTCRNGQWYPDEPSCESKVKQCPFPGHGPHSGVNVTAFFSPPSTIASYYCELGFVLVGHKIRQCLNNGSWSERIPTCAAKLSMNRRVVSVSPLVDQAQKHDERGVNILDDSNTYCSSAEGANRETSYWKVDILEETAVALLVLIFGNYIDINATLYYGTSGTDKHPITLNDYTLTTWAGKVSVDNEYSTYEYKLKNPIKLRYLTVEVAPVTVTTLHFCELIILSKKASSFGQCYSDSRPEQLKATTSILHDTCYTFFHAIDASMPVAYSKCKEITNGTLVSDVTDEVQDLLSLNLGAYYQRRRIDKLYRIGGYMDTENQGQKGKLQWLWNDKNPIKKLYWGYAQPNMPVGEPACITLSGRLQWQWDDKPCDERLNFICQHRIQKCGYPDAQPLTPLNDVVINTDIGTKVVYHCPDEYEVKGDRVRRCEESGRWSGRAPVCEQIGSGGTSGHHKGEKGGLPIGAIIGIVAGIIILLLIIIIVTVVILKKRQGSAKMIKYSAKTESAETLDADDKKGTGRADYSTMEKGKK